MAGADRMMASKVLSGLEQRGLLARLPHPGDTRAKRIEVTADGSALVRQAVRIVAGVDDAAFGPPSPQRDELRERLREVASVKRSLTH